MATASIPLTRQSSSDDMQSTLECFAHHIKGFSFENAKDAVDKLALQIKTEYTSMNKTCYYDFLVVLSQTAQAEKNYVNLSFLNPKGLFSRRENALKTTYNYLLTELKNISTQTRANLLQMSGTGQSVFKHLVSQIEAYITVRLRLISIYEDIAQLGEKDSVVLGEIRDKLRKLTAEFDSAFHHPVVTPIQSHVARECEILGCLLRCQIKLAKLRFLPSLSALYHAKGQLQAWLECIVEQPRQKQTAWFGLVKTEVDVPQPLLCVWMKTYYEALLSKASLLFGDVLARQAPPDEFRKQLNNLSINYQHRIATFAQKYQLAHACIVHRCTDHQSFQGLGYIHPDRELEGKDGVEGQYPIIFNYSQDPTLKLSRERHIDIVMLLAGDNLDKLDNDKTVTYYDPKINISYFIVRLEAELYFCLIFLSKRTEKEWHISAFLHDFISEMRLSRVYNMLKGGHR